ncbi:thaumatin-like protein 1b [Phalaenopsis equestris]|uniref:thaumatin-like protein 1b n=1 Tax=Phalaenopsis equestris TaxID=78828 RepID=UPI0009E31AAB|nr:thaumatin-like protein 1b [Phalaenopsis equestris]
MASSSSASPIIHLLLALLSLLSPVSISTTFTITNNCGYTVWPGILSGAGTPPASTTGFSLSQGESRSLSMPSSWSGRLWGRTLCSTNPSTSQFSCATGDCNSGTLACSGGATPPATLAEFTLAGSGGLDFFDVSLVDGYNLPILIVPKSSAAGKCSATGCAVDLNGLCPSELRVSATEEDGKSVACRSACEAFGKPEFCCSGEYGNPNTCKPSSYSEFFKNACPRAYSYAYDDASSTFTCEMGTDYEISFCPTTTSKKAGENIPRAGGIPLINDTMVFMGVVDTSEAIKEHMWPAIPILLIFWLSHLLRLFLSNLV